MEDEVINGEVGADNAAEIINETQAEQPEQVAQVEQYIPDVPQLAEPLKPRTAHFAFRRGRI